MRLSQNQLDILRAIKQNPGSNIAQILRDCHHRFARGYDYMMVKRLEDRGLLRKTPGVGNDKRLWLTYMGEACVA